jgi:uncharacterized protein
MIAYHPLFRNPHIQSVLGHFWPRPTHEAALERRLFETEPGVRVLVESQRPEGEAAGEVIMVHGLEGSGQAGYIRSLSHAALRAGYAAHRFHMRTCGGTERLCDTLYHAGLTSDLKAVLSQMREEGRRPAWLVGFSLGGNVVVKLAGELGEDGPALVRGVCAVSAALDLEASSHRISRPDNRFYEKRFVRRMRARLIATGRYSETRLAGLETLRDFDNRITAPEFGFGDATGYYTSQSAIRFLGGVRVPVLLVQAKDDTFIPFETFESDAVRGNPWVRVAAVEHGGHLGFLGRRPGRFWSDAAVMSFIAGEDAMKGRVSSSR